jgi:uncharacterized protein YdaU (DUF1376 family)
MQLYVSDYLADTAHLNAQQHGAYMLLLMNYWQRGKPLDNSGNRLAFVARMTPEEWEDNRDILAEFFWVDGDIWTHARVENDLSKVREKSEQASNAGKRSAVKREINGRSTDVQRDDDLDLTDAQRTFNHKDKDKDKEEDKEEIYTFERFWNTYPIKVGKGTAVKAFEKARKRASAQIIIEGAERYARDPNRDPSFTAHPSTWLNGDRWLDAPLPPKRAQDAPRGVITTPTPVPPRYVSPDTRDTVTMPDSVKEVLNTIRFKA